MIESIDDLTKLVVAGETNWKQYGEVTTDTLFDLILFNYTPAAIYEGRWNFFEQISRGLIINRVTGEVVAWPFDKFFNWMEGGRKAKGHIMSITEKVDGSLGILYRNPGTGKPCIATRGSFKSDQAFWATNYLQRHYDLSDLPDNLTLLFEIIYPDNRVVVDYGEREDLVLLAARDRFTGAYLPFFPDVYQLGMQFGFTLPKVYAFNDVTTLLELCGEIEVDQEGYVVEFSDGQRFKFKGDRYLELHKIVTGMSLKNTLHAVRDGTIDDLYKSLPEEFHGQLDDWHDEICVRWYEYKTQVEAAYAAVPKDDRKTMAIWIMQHHKDISSAIFALADEKPIDPIIYKWIEKDLKS